MLHPVVESNSYPGQNPSGAPQQEQSGARTPSKPRWTPLPVVHRLFFCEANLYTPEIIEIPLLVSAVPYRRNTCPQHSTQPGSQTDGPNCQIEPVTDGSRNSEVWNCQQSSACSDFERSFGWQVDCQSNYSYSVWNYC